VGGRTSFWSLICRRTIPGFSFVCSAGYPLDGNVNAVQQALLLCKYLFVCFQGHQDEVFVLEAHPTDPHILLSAGEWFFLLSPYLDKTLYAKMLNSPTLTQLCGGVVTSCLVRPFPDWAVQVLDPLTPRAFCRKHFGGFRAGFRPGFRPN